MQQELDAERDAHNAECEELRKKSQDDSSSRVAEADQQRQVAEAASAEAQERFRNAASEIDELKRRVQCIQQD
eukprot:35938-Amphidinium_carterae.1